VWVSNQRVAIVDTEAVVRLTVGARHPDSLCLPSLAQQQLGPPNPVARCTPAHLAEHCRKRAFLSAVLVVHLCDVSPKLSRTDCIAG
jgi:hypothetical protein